MARFVVGKELSDAIRSLLEEPGVKCAVAFWGAGSEKLVKGPDAQVICNLVTGGTNPHALQKVKARLRKRDDLHAKVYIGSKFAVVASANASANGLGLEGSEQSGWIEAGTILENTANISKWFDSLWGVSSDIKSDDWIAAELAWKARSKPTVPFLDFEFGEGNFPLVAWEDEADWSVCEDNITEQVPNYEGELKARIDKQIEEGLELESPEDLAYLKNRWVLVWTPRQKDRMPRSNLEWRKLDSIVIDGGFQVEGDDQKKDVVLGVDNQPPPPFNAKDRKFLAALRTVLSQPKFLPLVESPYAKPYYANNYKIMGDLWKSIKSEYTRA